MLKPDETFSRRCRRYEEADNQLTKHAIQRLAAPALVMCAFSRSDQTFSVPN